MANVKAICNFEYQGNQVAQGKVFEVSEADLDRLVDGECVVLTDESVEDDGRNSQTSAEVVQPETQPVAADQGATATPAPLEGTSGLSSVPTSESPNPSPVPVPQPQAQPMSSPTPEQLAEDMRLAEGGSGSPINVTIS